MKKKTHAPASDTIAITALRSDPRQIRRHTDRNLTMIGDGLKAVGAARSIVVDEDNVIFAGNGTIDAAKQHGFSRVRVIEADGAEIIAVRRRGLTDKQKVELALYDNRSSDFAEYDPEALARITDLVGVDADAFFSAAEHAALLGMAAGAEGADAASLVERFGVPPFSVLDARQGYWQARKAAWLALGIESDLGRGQMLTLGSEHVTAPGLNYYRDQEKQRAAAPDRVNHNLQQSHPATTATINFYARKRALEAEAGRKLTTAEAKALLAARGELRDDRAANKAAVAAKRRANATPGGSLMPAANYSKSKARGDGKGRAIRPADNLLGLSAQAEDYRRGTGKYAKRAKTVSK